MQPAVKKTTYALLAFYIAVLFWIILFKMGFSLEAPERIRMINLVPFAESTYSDGRVNTSELLNNVLIFVPLGLYLTMLWGRAPIWARILAVFGISLLLEALQYALAIGVSDITDLMGNTAGGAVGILASALLYRLVKNRSRLDMVLMICALAGSLCFAALAALLLIANG